MLTVWFIVDNNLKRKKGKFIYKKYLRIILPVE
jgi:hypothetical protein